MNELAKFEVRESDFADDLEGITPRLQKIKMPQGTGTSFEMPNENGEFDSIKEVKGIVIDNHPFNLFFLKPMGSGDPPECWSNDGKKGKLGECKTCKYNFVDADPRCSNKRALFFMLEGREFPIELDLPPTSLGSWAWFISNLLATKLNTKMIEISVKLETGKSNEGFPHPKCIFTISKHLNQSEYLVAITLSDKFRNITRGYAEVIENEFVPEMEENPIGKPDFKLCQAILSKTGYDSKNPNRHLLNQTITGIPESSKWTEKECKTFLDYCASFCNGEKYTTEDYKNLKDTFDKLCAQ